MANQDGTTPHAVIAKLESDPSEFDFFAAVRLIQKNAPEFRRIGYSSNPSEDPVRFAQSPALEFAPSILEAFRQAQDGKFPVLYSRHFGLFGPNGPLPLCLTEYARNRILHEGDMTFAAFCNVFHHRMTSFFFRAWADAQKTVDYDRPEESVWHNFIGSLVGVGLESLEQRDAVPDTAKLFYAGRLVQQNRNAEGLEAIIQDFFGVKTQLLQFVGRWLNLPADALCRFNRSASTRQLGLTTIVGSQIWNCQMHFRLRMGSMKLADLEKFLPDGQAFRRLRDWVKYYTNDEFTWDVQMVLAKEEVPAAKLGTYGKLGWTTWLKTKPFQQDAEDLILSPTN